MSIFFSARSVWHYARKKLSCVQNPELDISDSRCKISNMSPLGEILGWYIRPLLDHGHTPRHTPGTDTKLLSSKKFEFLDSAEKCGGWQTPLNPDDLALVSGNTDNLANTISIQSCPPRSDSAVSTEGRCAKCHSQDLNRLVCFKKEVAHLFRESLVKMPLKIMTPKYPKSDLSRIFVQSYTIMHLLLIFPQCNEWCIQLLHLFRLSPSFLHSTSIWCGLTQSAQSCSIFLH